MSYGGRIVPQETLFVPLIFFPNFSIESQDEAYGRSFGAKSESSHLHYCNLMSLPKVCKCLLFPQFQLLAFNDQSDLAQLDINWLRLPLLVCDCPIISAQALHVPYQRLDLPCRSIPIHGYLDFFPSKPSHCASITWKTLKQEIKRQRWVVTSQK